MKNSLYPPPPSQRPLVNKSIFAILLLFVGGLFSVHAQDMLVLKDGNIIEAKVIEISPTEIRYKRFDHLDGPTIVVSRTDILSIRYENGKVDIFNQSGQAASTEGTPQLSQPNPLQNILNTLPAITIAGNTLKFEFGGDSWVSRVNGENFSAGTITFEESATGGMLTLKQTHIWPGAIGKTAGKVANAIPGGGQVGNVLNTAGNVAGVLGPVEAPGTEIILEYKAGPPASLKFVKQRKTDKADTVASGDKVFTANQRWRTFGLNFLIPGLGSYAVMHDGVNGTIQMITGLAGLGMFIGGGGDDWTITGIGMGLYLSNIVLYNAIVSTTYGDNVPTVSNFTTGQRWGTFFLNLLVPGLGSYVVMHDWVNGTILLSLFGPTSLVVGSSYDGSMDEWLLMSVVYHMVTVNPVAAAIVSIVSGRSPSATASVIDPTAWNIALLPGRGGGIEKVLVAYTLRFRGWGENGCYKGLLLSYSTACRLNSAGSISRAAKCVLRHSV